MKRLDAAQICEINITPLTDVFLVLLIIMMIVTPMMDFGGLPLGISASDTRTPVTTKDKKPLTIDVTKGGTFEISGVEIPRPILAAELSSRMEGSPDIAVRVHPEASYEALVVALGAIYQTGVVRVNVYQEDDGAETPAPAAPEKQSKGK
jgi:biopolymer transport protein ExbD/biopolymer transport protein TolR